MPPSDGARATPARLLIAALVVAGIVVTLLVFYPGVMTYDAKYVYLDVLSGFRGDWQSPVMTSLWALIDPLAPGSASMFVLIATLYWLGFGLLAVTLARRSIWLAVALLVLALSPPAFLFVGIIWRDVLLASLWLLAVALAFAVADRGLKLRVPVQVLALCLLALGVLLRPNALIAAPILAAYIAWPTQFRWKRTALLFVPAALGLFGLMQVVYYGVLGATRQHIEQSIMVFDLGGISHFAKENQFPGTWTDDESQRITNRCYKPVEWDIYWRLDPCQFVMQKLEKEQHLFGTPAVSSAWMHAIARHPISYLEHRTAFFWHFLSADNLTFWRYDLDDTSKLPLAERPSMVVLAAIDDALKATPLLRLGSWLLLCLAVCAIGWRHSDTPAGAFALAVCGSAAIYVLTFFSVGVAADFRYGYWAVLAAIGGAIVLATQGVRPRSP
jgi:hypothetical protein